MLSRQMGLALRTIIARARAGHGVGRTIEASDGRTVSLPLTRGRRVRWGGHGRRRRVRRGSGWEGGEE